MVSFKKWRLTFVFLQESSELQSKLNGLQQQLLQIQTNGCTISSAEASRDPSTTCTTPSSSSGATSPSLSSRNSFINENPSTPPLKAHVRAFLPKNQRTMVRFIAHDWNINQNSHESMKSCLESWWINCDGLLNEYRLSDQRQKKS